MDKLDRNKKAAQAFYDLMFNQCRPEEMAHEQIRMIPLLRHLTPPSTVVTGVSLLKPEVRRLR